MSDHYTDFTFTEIDELFLSGAKIRQLYGRKNTPADEVLQKVLNKLPQTDKDILSNVKLSIDKHVADAELAFLGKDTLSHRNKVIEQQLLGISSNPDFIPHPVFEQGILLWHNSDKITTREVRLLPTGELQQKIKVSGQHATYTVIPGSSLFKCMLRA